MGDRIPSAATVSARRSSLLAAAAVALSLLALPSGAAGAVKRLHYEYGPILVKPGQNTIAIELNRLKPPGPGWITRFKPDLVRKGGEIPRVDVIHLHHGVWLKNGYPLFAAGEEKTVVDLPDGFGYRHDPQDKWFMNHMVHNLTPNPDEVYITYDLDFIPADAPEAAGMQLVRTQWLDVMGLSGYPVFDAKRGAGARGRYTYPDDNPRVRAEHPQRNAWTVERDGALVQTAGHLHPGGLHTDMTLTRAGRTVRLFRSEAKYWEPAGAVSWDAAMTATPPNWRVGVKRGDVIRVSGTYDTSRASWYESMAIMPAAFAPGVAGPDPFAQDVDVPGRVTHGPLKENRNHGGELSGLPDPRRLPAGALARGPVKVKDFMYGRGDLNATGAAGRPPVVTQGSALRFLNQDAAKTIFHTITSCREPCNRATGIAYPLADGRATFDSGELGFGPRGLTAAANTDRWSTPKTLAVGTYTYFCRVHPFMRGAFRVKGQGRAAD